MVITSTTPLFPAAFQTTSEKDGQLYLSWDQGQQVISLDRRQQAMLQGLLAERSAATALQWLRQTRPAAQFSEMDLMLFATLLLQRGFLSTAPTTGSLTVPNYLRMEPPGWPRRLRRFLLGVLASAGVLVLLDAGNSRPSVTDFFWSGVLVVDVLTGLLWGWLLVGKHELAHWLAAHTAGLPAKLRLDHRFSSLVVETQVDGIYLLPEGKRYRIYLKGVLVDLGVLALLVLLRQGELGIAVSPLAASLLAQGALLQMLSIIWQLLVFQKTDLYYALSDYFDRPNLQSEGWQYLRQVISQYTPRRAWGEGSPSSPPRSGTGGGGGRVPAFLKFYTALMIAGFLLLTYRLVNYTIPLTVTILWSAWQGLSGPGWLRWAAALVLGLEAFQLGALVWTIFRKPLRLAFR